MTIIDKNGKTWKIENVQGLRLDSLRPKEATIKTPAGDITVSVRENKEKINKLILERTE